MTKALIFADSHTDVETMCTIVNVEKPDVIFHLGDHITDAEQLHEKYPNIQMFSVLGNTDTNNVDEEWIKYIEICGKRIMLTHGNIFLDGIETFEDLTSIFLRDDRCDSADIILFGHIHTPFLNYRNGKWLMNPGRVGRISGEDVHATYGVLKIDSGKIRWDIIEVD